jgi:hypothetical protein
VGVNAPLAETFMKQSERWPSLPWDEWAETCDTLHLWTQVVGKVKAKLHPFLNEYWHVAFYPTPRGLTTGRIPYENGAFAASFDFVDHVLLIDLDDGRTVHLPLRPQTVAAFYAAVMEALRSLGIEISINPVPDEIPGAVPFAVDQAHASYDPAFVRRWSTVQLQTALVLDHYRSSFVGKSSPVLFWWGSFDTCVSRFCGRPAPPLSGVPRWMRLSADQEQFTCGFWPGNVTMHGVRVNEPMFFAYIYPDATGFKDAAVRPDAARFDTRVGEFLLPYEEARRAPNPGEAILEFFNSSYEAAAKLANWDPSLNL